MRRVLFTASTYSHIAHFHLPYLRELQSRGWETLVACAGAPETAPFADVCFHVPFRKSMTAPENLAAGRRVREIVREERPDLIVTHTSLAAFFTRLAVKGMKDRPRLVNMVHGYLFDGDTPALKRRLLLSAEKLTAPETDLLLTMNEWDHRAARSHRLSRRVAKVPGIGVDFSPLDGAKPEDGRALREAYGIAPDAFLLLYAAEFSERKSQRVLIEALRFLPEKAVLALPGSGALLEECRMLAAVHGLERRVIFPGYIQDMAPWYRAADAAVSSSRSEGLPFNIMEAMHCALPVAASAVKGNTDLICDGETGLLYPYGDSLRCAERIDRLMKQPELRQRLGFAARRAVEKYALSKVMGQVLEQYLSVLP